MVERETLLEVTTMFRILIKGITQKWNKLGGNYNLSFPQFKMLHVLLQSGPQKVSNLAEKLGLTSAAITGLTDRLIVEGYAKRDRTEEDRRVVFISITDKGKDTLKKILSDHEESTKTIFTSLEDEEVMHLKRIFTIMIDNLEK
ncbi:MarR family transcriptional regulator [Paenibacillus sp. M1]|uniref:MarR family transcriptional regulator n=1 Tax=Paenibacillus haidiansis TaxID=1574488 RepID=A0ABU7VP43_9BACL